MAEILWAPWRMEYIRTTVKQEATDGCIFCQMVGNKDDEKNLILYRSDNVFVVMNLYPYNSGHLMVIPRKHVGTLSSLTADEHGELGRTLSMCQDVLRECYNPQGFNIGMNIGRAAGAGILDHLHYHIVPRWNGDSNFMSALSDTKVLSESLPESWKRLKSAFDRRLS